MQKPSSNASDVTEFRRGSISNSVRRPGRPLARKATPETLRFLPRQHPHPRLQVLYLDAADPPRRIGPEPHGGSAYSRFPDRIV